MSSNEQKIQYLVGNENFTNDASIPYNDLVCEFLDNFSKELFNSKLSKEFPDLGALAFWCRKQNILNLKKKFISSEFRKGLGLVFHITPSNIPTNFAYSLLFGLLTGNTNVVKVPSREFKQIDIICNVINKTLKKKKFFNLKKKIIILRYLKNNEFTKKISSICDARLIWGGDKSVNEIRKFKTKEKVLDIAFSDKFSFCVINAKKMMQLNRFDFDRLVERFYNDTYLVDQNACSSPYLILWINDKFEKGKIFFWKRLNHYLKKNYDMPKISSVDKFTKVCSDIINLKNLKNYQTYDNLIYVISLKKLDKSVNNLRGKWGYFYQFNISNLGQIFKNLNSNCQTMTYYGLSNDIIKKAILNNNLKGIDRIVPIGQALDISLNWDGYDMNKTLTRIIDIR